MKDSSKFKIKMCKFKNKPENEVSVIQRWFKNV